MIGAVLSATGILIGPGLGVIGIGVVMVLYGLVVSMFSRRASERIRINNHYEISGEFYCAPIPELDTLMSA